MLKGGKKMNTILTKYIENEIFYRPTKILNDIYDMNDVKFNYRMEYYTVINYIDRFLKGNPLNRFITLSGIRAVGKSTLMFQVYDYLLNEKKINPTNILYLSCDKLKKITNNDIMDAITNYLIRFHNKIPETVNEPIFLLIDEAQYDKDWSLTGKIIFDDTKNIFMIFTGSSALNLSFSPDAARRMLKIPITPLNYSQQLKLKYNNFDNNISKSIENIIFTGNTENSSELERKILKLYANFKNYDINEFRKFILFGGFPSAPYQKPNEITEKIINMTDKVINYETVNLAFQILNFFALQDPGEVSYESMSNLYESNKTTVKKVLGLLEKTLLLFHVEAFTSSAKRTTKPHKYYFSTSSIKHNLSLDYGNAVTEGENAYMGKLLEHLVASSFFNINYKRNISYKVYYDGKNKGKKNVDFIVQKGLEKPIPIEVSWGMNNKSQIKRGIYKYKSDYGIIISNTTPNIIKDDNIIYMPPEIFALM